MFWERQQNRISATMNSSQSDNQPRIAVATSTRADWGLLSPICQRLRQMGATLHIIASNLHFSQDTAYEILADGFDIACSIKTDGTPAQIAADVLKQSATALHEINPDIIVILGDRFEMLSTAMAATLSHIPIAHIAGGAVSEGAFDDSFRHAITKLASLHLTETDEYRKRVIQLGENPEYVITTGAIGLHNILDIKPMSKDELGKSIGLSLERPFILATMHAATLDPTPPTKYVETFLRVLATEAKDYDIIITYPNNDVDPEPIIEQIERFASQAPEQRVCIPSLGRLRYAAALRYATAVAGNSSSGIVEAPSAHIPTLDIGIRQQGRTAAASVVHCGTSEEEMRVGLRKVLSKEMQEIAKDVVNPYYRPDTVDIMAREIITYAKQSPRTKHFYDIPYDADI